MLGNSETGEYVFSKNLCNKSFRLARSNHVTTCQNLAPVQENYINILFALKKTNFLVFEGMLMFWLVKFNQIMRNFLRGEKA